MPAVAVTPQVAPLLVGGHVDLDGPVLVPRGRVALTRPPLPDLDRLLLHLRRLLRLQILGVHEAPIDRPACEGRRRPDVLHFRGELLESVAHDLLGRFPLGPGRADLRTVLYPFPSLVV